MFVKIAVNFPHYNSLLTYKVPEDLPIEIGMMVEVPLGRRKEFGCVIGFTTPDNNYEIKEILCIKNEFPPLTETELDLMKWMSEYYHYSLGALISDIVPNAKKRPRPLKIDPAQNHTEVPPELTLDQKIITDKIHLQLETFSKHLIHGVTGSGKSRIFLDLMKAVKEKNKSIIYLLPEINLTPQFLTYFSRYLGMRVLPFHSELTASEKYLIWQEASKANEPILFIGVRSSVFLPVKNLGLIIVDEEHDSSFKQEDRCTYHARDVATKKAQLYQCSIVLGSATPSLETYYHYFKNENKSNYYYLGKRVAGGELPKFIKVDLRGQKLSPDTPWPISKQGLDKIREGLQNKEQVLVFVNRLGYASFIQCRSCGHQFHCLNCSVSLRYFKDRNELECQHCQVKYPMPKQCPKCGCLTLTQKGYGTERIYEQLSREFPENHFGRFDREEIKTFDQLKNRLQDFHDHKIDVLIGTQMLSKGHNFERVKKVIVLGLDQQLNFPDFRSQEKVFQLLVQVAGRAGRYAPDGEVILQTHDPENELFEKASHEEITPFYDEELKLRKLCECPPFMKLATLNFHGKNKDELISFLFEKISPLLNSLAHDHFPNVRILGPRPSMIEKRANLFTWNYLLKSDDLNQLHNLLKSFEINYKFKTPIKYKLDIDPQHIT